MPNSGANTSLQNIAEDYHPSEPGVGCQVLTYAQIQWKENSLRGRMEI